VITCKIIKSELNIHWKKNLVSTENGSFFDTFKVFDLKDQDFPVSFGSPNVDLDQICNVAIEKCETKAGQPKVKAIKTK
jgi:hypothetical protein